MRMGLPRLLTSDQGGEFRNAIDKSIMEMLGIKHHFLTPYHPQVTHDSFNVILLSIGQWLR